MRPANETRIRPEPGRLTRFRAIGQQRLRFRQRRQSDEQQNDSTRIPNRKSRGIASAGGGNKSNEPARGREPRNFAPHVILSCAAHCIEKCVDGTVKQANKVAVAARFGYYSWRNLEGVLKTAKVS
jgi:hypothetical protein